MQRIIREKSVINPNAVMGTAGNLQKNSNILYGHCRNLQKTLISCNPVKHVKHLFQ